MLNARKTLQEMFDHYPEDHELKKYLRKHCLHLLDKPQGDTGLDISILESPNWPKMPSTYSASLIKELQNLSGTYAIYSETSHNFCIGSTTDYGMRLYNHYADFLKPSLADRPLYSEIHRVGGWDKMAWKPLVNVSNYHLGFIKDNLEYTGDYTVFRVLQTFTQYEARIYEQAIQSLIQPKLNGPGDITFTTKWNPQDVRPSFLGQRPFIAKTESGKELNFDSLSSAADMLGTSRKTITTVMNYLNGYVDCPGIEERARFYEPHLPLKEGSPYKNPHAAPDLVGLDYSSLPLKGIFAYDENYKLHREFNTRSEAAHYGGFGDKYYQITRYVNKRFITCVVAGVSMKLLFAQNPLVKGGRKRVSCLNVDTKEIHHYKSVNDCVKAIGLDVSTASTIIKNYIKPGKVYKGKYLITYTIK